MSSPVHVRKALHLVSMKAKLQNFVGLRLLLVAALAGFLILFSARTLFSPSATATSRLRGAGGGAGGDGTSCSKLPSPVSEALVHYATSNVTPQQTASEIGVSLRVLQSRSPCNFLVFGLGHDSPMWAALNHGGRTVFLEEDASWIASVRSAHPGLESYHVTYDTRLTEADDLIALRDHPGCTAQPDLAAATEAECRLALRGLPAVFHEIEWDLIMVDAPTGWTPEAPGRMGAIYTAGMAARARRPGDGATDVFVHDVDRTVEDTFSKAFLCEAYLTEQVGRIRHFVIPSHKEKPGTPFCPQN
jgi:glucuronoxylan 4-O-methyltransferase